MIDPIAVRRQNALFALLLFVVSLCLPLVDQLSLWPLMLLGGSVGALLLWGALSDESIASPVIVLVLTALPTMFVSDHLAIGAMASVVVALMMGEHLANAQSARYATPGHAPWSTDAGALVMHGGAAAGAVAIALLATALPEARVWSLSAVGALAIAAVALQRRRASMPDVPLPPPTPPTPPG